MPLGISLAHGVPAAAAGRRRRSVGPAGRLRAARRLLLELVALVAGDDSRRARLRPVSPQAHEDLVERARRRRRGGIRRRLQLLELQVVVVLLLLLLLLPVLKL